MKTVFADTAYWIALLNPRDQHRATALSVSRSMGQALIVTSQMVLVEFLNSFAAFGPRCRELAVALVRRISGDPAVRIVPQTDGLFAEALKLYGSRPDKGWSLTDCASMQIMEDQGITDVLTSDIDFEQAGYHALLRGG